MRGEDKQIVLVEEGVVGQNSDPGLIEIKTVGAQRKDERIDAGKNAVVSGLIEIKTGITRKAVQRQVADSDLSLVREASDDKDNFEQKMAEARQKKQQAQQMRDDIKQFDVYDVEIGELTPSKADKILLHPASGYASDRVAKQQIELDRTTKQELLEISSIDDVSDVEERDQFKKWRKIELKLKRL